MNANKKFRAVSNLNGDGRDPSQSLINRGRAYGSGHGEVTYHATLGTATAFLLRAGGGGVIYLDADDTVAAVVQPGHREFRAVTQGPDSREEYFANPKSAKEWLRKRGSGGWVEQYDQVLAKFTPREKLEAAK